MPDINTTTEGEVFGGISGGALFNLFGLGGSAPPVGTVVQRGIELPTKDLALAKDQQRVQAQIDAATAAGEQPSALLFAQLETIESQRDLLNRQFLREQELNPALFASPSVNIAPGTPLSFFINLFNLARPALEALVGGRGQPSLGTFGIGHPPTRLPGRFPVATAGTGARGIPTRLPAPSQPNARAPSGQTAQQGAVATFLNCLSTAFGAGSTTRGALQSILSPSFFQTILRTIFPGGRAMPFVATASPGAATSGFDFGGFLGGAIDIAKRFLGPTVGPGTAFPNGQRAAFPLIPAARAILPAARQFLPAFGGGVAGGLVEDFFSFGGASTLDESAAFTDPVPGACRPKMHVKTNPCTGKGVWFVPRGRPLVFSGDLSAAKRLDRVAKTLDKARPRRHHHHRTSHRRPR